MDLNDILEQWTQDCELTNKLDDDSRNTPKLHAKYLQYHSLTKLQLLRAENAQKILLKQKWLYYNGKMSEEEIKKSGWDPDPFDGLKVMKGDMDYYYDSDPEIQKSEDRIQYLKTILDTLKEIIDTLKWRHQNIRNIIDWRRFESGN
jgi:c-di-GMP-related signal transduction protein